MRIHKGLQDRSFPHVTTEPTSWTAAGSFENTGTKEFKKDTQHQPLWIVSKGTCIELHGIQDNPTKLGHGSKRRIDKRWLHRKRESNCTQVHLSDCPRDTNTTENEDDGHVFNKVQNWKIENLKKNEGMASEN